MYLNLPYWYDGRLGFRLAGLGIQYAGAAIAMMFFAQDHEIVLDAAGIGIRRGRSRYLVHWQHVKGIPRRKQMVGWYGMRPPHHLLGVRLATGTIPLARSDISGQVDRLEDLMLGYVHASDKQLKARAGVGQLVNERRSE
ncbi:MAG: hypothetical protein ABR562_08525 [Thermoplasmatota archaeon]